MILGAAAPRDESEFGKRFVFKADDLRTASAVLSPALKERLLAMSDKGGEDFRVRITPEGKVHLISFVGFIPLGITNEQELDRQIGSYTESVRYYTDFIDALSAEDALFKK